MRRFKSLTFWPRPDRICLARFFEKLWLSLKAKKTMKLHSVKVCPSKKPLPKKEQLAWKLAAAALDPAPVPSEVRETLISRIIDSAGAAAAALLREPAVHAREQALSYPRKGGACVFGLDSRHRFHAEWAAWANGAAVRELDFHDTFLAADYSHPADSIPPLLAVAQQMGRSGEDLIRGLAAAYEIHISLVKGICLHKHKIDHIAHLCPAQAAGIGALLNMPQDRLYQAIQQAVHVSFTARQSRKGEISSWKAYAPAFAGKMAIEAADRALRGENSPSPIYEGEDSVIAYMLDGPEASYQIPLPEPGEEKRAILETYTKAHSAEYQAQAFIDLAFELKSQIKKEGRSLKQIKEVRLWTSHHTHYVIGDGAGDPQKRDPRASRETLDHSLMYLFAVALEDGAFHHIKSYSRERASRPETIALWSKVKTFEDEAWTRAYHNPDPAKRLFGGRAEICFYGGSALQGEKGVADAHPNGKASWEWGSASNKEGGRQGYIRKFRSLADGALPKQEADRFLGLALRLERLSPRELGGLNIQAGLPAASKSRGIL